MTTPTGGSPEHLLQDQSRDLSRALAGTPDAPLHAREAAAALALPVPDAALHTAVRLVLDATPEQLPMALDALRHRAGAHHRGGMTDCKHPAITAWRFERDGNPAGMWSCADCGHKFVPLDIQQEDDAKRYRKLRDRGVALGLRSIFNLMPGEWDDAIDAAAPGA